jgi:hypothetical protein
MVPGSGRVPASQLPPRLTRPNPVSDRIHPGPPAQSPASTTVEHHQRTVSTAAKIALPFSPALAPPVHFAPRRRRIELAPKEARSR